MDAILSKVRGPGSKSTQAAGTSHAGPVSPTPGHAGCWFLSQDYLADSSFPPPLRKRRAPFGGADGARLSTWSEVPEAVLQPSRLVGGVSLPQPLYRPASPANFNFRGCSERVRSMALTAFAVVLADQPKTGSCADRRRGARMPTAGPPA